MSTHPTPASHSNSNQLLSPSSTSTTVPIPIPQPKESNNTNNSNNAVHSTTNRSPKLSESPLTPAPPPTQPSSNTSTSTSTATPSSSTSTSTSSNNTSSTKRKVGVYEVHKKLGQGSFATVWLGSDPRTKQAVAVKSINRAKLQLNKKHADNLESEIAIMRRVCHPNIVRLLDIVTTDRHIYLVLEYCSGGDLAKLIRKNGALPELIARHKLRHLASGLKFLRQSNLIHRDLKPQNLLLDTSEHDAILKIADFGFARYIAPASMVATLCGSPLYMAPEILKYQKYDASADLWSVGTILYEMVFGRPPFTGANHLQLLQRIEQTDTIRFPTNIEVSNECKNLITSLLKRLPSERISFDDFFNHPFLRDTLHPTPLHHSITVPHISAASSHHTHHHAHTHNNTSNDNSHIPHSHSAQTLSHGTSSPHLTPSNSITLMKHSNATINNNSVTSNPLINNTNTNSYSSNLTHGQQSYTPPQDNNQRQNMNNNNDNNGLHNNQNQTNQNSNGSNHNHNHTANPHNNHSNQQNNNNDTNLNNNHPYDTYSNHNNHKSISKEHMSTPATIPENQSLYSHSNNQHHSYHRQYHNQYPQENISHNNNNPNVNINNSNIDSQTYQHPANNMNSSRRYSQSSQPSQTYNSQYPQPYYANNPSTSSNHLSHTPSSHSHTHSYINNNGHNHGPPLPPPSNPSSVSPPPDFRSSPISLPVRSYDNSSNNNLGVPLQHPAVTAVVGGGSGVVAAGSASGTASGEDYILVNNNEYDNQSPIQSSTQPRDSPLTLQSNNSPQPPPPATPPTPVAHASIFPSSIDRRSSLPNNSSPLLENLSDEISRIESLMHRAHIVAKCAEDAINPEYESSSSSSSSSAVFGLQDHDIPSVTHSQIAAATLFAKSLRLLRQCFDSVMRLRHSFIDTFPQHQQQLNSSNNNIHEKVENMVEWIQTKYDEYLTRCTRCKEFIEAEHSNTTHSISPNPQIANNTNAEHADGSNHNNGFNRSVSSPVLRSSSLVAAVSPDEWRTRVSCICAERLMYSWALAQARSAAVDEMMGTVKQANAKYKYAIRMIDQLTDEVSSSGGDKADTTILAKISQQLHARQEALESVLLKSSQTPSNLYNSPSINQAQATTYRDQSSGSYQQYSHHSFSKHDNRDAHLHHNHHSPQLRASVPVQQTRIVGDSPWL